jgi:hypothetical protein
MPQSLYIVDLYSVLRTPYRVRSIVLALAFSRDARLLAPDAVPTRPIIATKWHLAPGEPFTILFE